MRKCAFIYHPDYLRHETGGHPEQAARVAAIAEAVTNAALPDVVTVTPRPASPALVRLVHTPDHVAQIRRLADTGGGFVDSDTYVSPDSFNVALLAVGGAIEAVRATLSGEVSSAFAAVRPPGHHATPTTAMGFCLFNNHAIAIKYAQQNLGLERVLVVDFDVHHGNGSQEAFWDDPSVLYVSLHEHPLFPGTGAATDTGFDGGRGYTVNVPLPAGVGDEGYARVFDEIIAPVARRFRPQLIVVSPGYDAHWMDPLALMELSTAGIAALMAWLDALAVELCEGRLVAILEGGYNLQALAASALATISVLAGVQPTDPLGPPRNRQTFTDVGPAIAQVKQAHRTWFAERGAS